MHVYVIELMITVLMYKVWHCCLLFRLVSHYESTAHEMDLLSTDLRNR